MKFAIKSIPNKWIGLFENSKRGALIGGVLLAGISVSTITAIYFKKKNDHIKEDILAIINEINSELSYAEGYNDCVEDLKEISKKDNYKVKYNYRSWENS